MSDINIGETTVFGDAESPNSNILIFMPAVLSVAATINSISLRITTRYSASNVYMGIYTDSSGSPASLKATTAETALPAGGNWCTANVVTPVLLSAATYWIAFVVSTMWQVVIPRDAATYESKHYGSYTYGALPSTAPTPDWSGYYRFSLYATLTPAAGNWPLLTMGNSLFNSMNEQLR